MHRRGASILICLVAAAALAGASSDAQAAGGKQLFGVAFPGYPTSSEFQRISTGGVRTVRSQIYWGTVEPTPGARNWQVVDALVTDASRAGVKLLPFLYGTPPWASQNAAAPPIYSPAARTAWTTFVADLARRYGTSGTFWAAHPELLRTPIDIWQVWNEVNFHYFWGSQPSARGYADLVKLTRAGLRAGDPAAKVLLAGIVPYKTAGAGDVPGDNYLRRLFRVKGMGKQFDAVGIHPFGKRPRVVLGALRDARALLKAAKVRAPIWVTEFGWTTGGQDYASSPLKATTAQQAQWVTTTYKRLGTQGKRLGVKRAFYYSLKDIDPSGVGDSWLHHMGLFAVDGQPKPAWFAYARAAGGTP